MGSRLSSIASRQLLIIGGCELPVEKSPYDSVEVFDTKSHYMMEEKMLIPVRGPMAHLYNNKVFLLGGC